MAKCESCIHKKVCKYKPPLQYPQWMIDEIQKKCQYYAPDSVMLKVKEG